ncbi:MAG: malectin domain-containing carbohydrate-binding protein, partial [Myxococcota bacterium]
MRSPTSLDVGVDGKLYVSQQDGLLVALTIERVFETNNGVATETWSVTDRADITVVQTMPNHDDFGDYQPQVQGRQVTGLATDVDAFGHVMLYVSSSDPRIGGSSGGEDVDLDTNSGVLSRLTQQVDVSGTLILDAHGRSQWSKVDLVRGLPRSEQNHSVNGIEIVPGFPKRLLVAVGGNTNAGAQGNNFAYTAEYFYSGAMVWVDLDALNTLIDTRGLRTYTTSGSPPQQFVFDLPTLDDPTRANDASGDLSGAGVATADVFGGNDGLNQAMFDPSGIVTIASVGYRNQYDVVVTAAGEAYTVDNGSNSGWGGVPLNINGEEIVDGDGDGTPDNGPAKNLANENGRVNKGDQLHRFIDDIRAPPSVPFYGGHPNFYRAHGMEAGFYLYAAADNALGLAAGSPLQLGPDNQLIGASAPVDLAPWIANADLLTGLDAQGLPNTDPRQALFRSPGRSTGVDENAPDGALYVWRPSTNGIDEYTASNGLEGWLITVSFDGGIHELDVAQAGGVQNVQTRSLTTKPLDVITQGDNDPYPGVILVAAYGADQIVVLSPESGVGATPDPSDRDADGLDDSFDPFCVDPDNGTRDVLSAGDVWAFTFANGPDDAPPNASPELYDGIGGYFSGGAIGFTGIMSNRAGLPETLYDAENIIFGGAPGVLQIKSVETGSPADNTQRNGFQVGFTPGDTLDSFSVETEVDLFHDELDSIPEDDSVSQGVFIGTGDQNSYVSVSMVRLSDGTAGFEVASQFAQDFVGAGPVETSFVPAPELALAGPLDTGVLGLDVDIASAVVTPWWQYTVGGNEVRASGPPVTLSGDAFLALLGEFTLGDDQGNAVPLGMAAGIIASRTGATGTFAADFDGLTLRGRGRVQPGPLVAAVNAGSSVPYTRLDGVVFAADVFGAGETYSKDRSIAGTEDDALYQTETWNVDGWTYDVPVSNGSYFVTLHFAEIWRPAFAPGVRVFDVELEGARVLDDLDIYSEVGKRAA